MDLIELYNGGELVGGNEKITPFVQAGRIVDAHSLELARKGRNKGQPAAHPALSFRNLHPQVWARPRVYLTFSDYRRVLYLGSGSQEPMRTH